MTSPSNRNLTSTPDAGALGEELVAQWAQKQGWALLHRRWRCRFGELDLVLAKHATSAVSGQKTEALMFVEVKTRRRKNWDEDGKLAVTIQKQTKLWKTAQLFLMQYPELAELPCQFDVAIVFCETLPQTTAIPILPDDGVLIRHGYRLTLLEYIPEAFSQM